MRHYLLPIVCVAALAGCGRGHDEQHGVTINGNGGSVTVSDSGEHMTFHDEKNKQTVEINSNGGAAPANLPDYAPVYPGARVTASVTGGPKNGMIVVQTNAAIADVIAFYKHKATADGFVVATDATVNGAMMFSANTADKKKTIVVVASPGNGATQAQITWGSN